MSTQILLVINWKKLLFNFTYHLPPSSNIFPSILYPVLLQHVPPKCSMPFQLRNCNPDSIWVLNIFIFKISLKFSYPFNKSLRSKDSIVTRNLYFGITPITQKEINCTIGSTSPTLCSSSISLIQILGSRIKHIENCNRR